MHKEFAVHKLNEFGMEKAQAIATSFDVLIDDLIGLCPESRELSIAKTKLEEACFFAKKAMASNPANQQE